MGVLKTAVKCVALLFGRSLIEAFRLRTDGGQLPQFKGNGALHRLGRRITQSYAPIRPQSNARNSAITIPTDCPKRPIEREWLLRQVCLLLNTRPLSVTDEILITPDPQEVTMDDMTLYKYPTIRFVEAGNFTLHQLGDGDVIIDPITIAAPNERVELEVSREHENEIRRRICALAGSAFEGTGLADSRTVDVTVLNGGVQVLGNDQRAHVSCFSLNVQLSRLCVK